ncbi:hypothetical protein K8Z61_16275 [Nocardioides sp. TRM66260-LWL]|uniref:FtsK/SpoIIIE domain-containing protein n=1 Tax=Nocardioides sp. TRM66260-LWL TaxID=2874478 RepID=UPI001CC57CF0|nr:FtsK/SpoIIIE domain-containing protein [Nocardioides sp. TRM66260-LWL]MBZ5736052.1 hypothetical protein [Nocardioides sp. TRM66260-LWL]
MPPAISAARPDARASDPSPPAPPSAPERDGPALALMGALPLLAGTGSLALVAGRGGRMLPLLGVTLLTAAVLVGAQLGRSRAARRRRLERLRGDYRAALEQWRTARDSGAGCEPAMADESLPVVVGTGLEDEHPARPAVPPDVDPGCLHALERALRLPGRRLPRLADLRTTERLVTSGAGARGRARAIVVDAARRHPPDRLRIAVLAGDEAAREAWRWTAWLPHARAASPEASEAAAALPRDVHLLLVVEAGDDPAEVLRAAGPSTTVLRVDPTGPASQVDEPFLDRAAAERAARGLARVGGVGHRDRRAQGLPRLEVMLGLDPAGSPVTLDLREAADGGQGPHGLLVGATGSGKSALLRSLVLDLAASHPPERLALGLIDFKGGAAFADLVGLPHVAGLATNLAGDLALVDRLASALTTEVAERQQRLSDAGRLPSLGAWTPETTLVHGPPPPRLLLVVDELGELLVARPDLLDVLTALGRVGRSLGIHLLVSTQRWEEGRLHGLEAHLSYRIALRTFSETESRAVLGLPDAARLPRAPGHGLLRADGVVRPFRSLDLTRPRPAPTRTVRSRPLGAAPSDAGHLVAWEQRLRSTAGSHPRRSAPIWTAELIGPLPLLDLLDPDAPTERPDGPDTDTAPTGIVAVGVRERPRGRRLERLEIDLDRGRHLLVVGGAGSGVSTALRSIAWAHVLHRAPRSLQVVLVDLAGRGLDPLRDLPHVTLRARADEPEALDELAARLREEMRARAGDGADDRPDLLVVVDGWGRLDALAPPVAEVLRGLPTADPARGLRCAVGAARWSDLRPAVRDRLRLLAELRLGDPGESGVDRRRAGDVPRDRPGRGLDVEGHDVLLACPGSTADEARMARSVRDAWPDHLETPTPSRSAVAPGRQRVAARADLQGAALLLGVAATPAGPQLVRLLAPLLVRGARSARADCLDLLVRRAVDRGTAWRMLRVGGAAAGPAPPELCVPWLDADEQDPAAAEARIAEIVRHLETRPIGPEDGGGPPAHPRLLVLADEPTPALLRSLLRLRSPGAAAWATLVVGGGADRTRPAPGWWTLDLGPLGALGPEGRLHRPAHPAVTIGTGPGTDVDGAGDDLRRGCASPGRSP